MTTEVEVETADADVQQMLMKSRTKKEGAVEGGEEANSADTILLLLLLRFFSALFFIAFSIVSAKLIIIKMLSASA